MDNNINNESEFNISSGVVRSFINFLKKCNQLYQEDLIFTKEMNGKQQDLLHGLEIPETMSTDEILKFGIEIRNLRQNRRKIKDELLLSEVINSFLKNNSTLIENLENLEVSIKDKENFIANRTYSTKSTVITTTSIENSELKEDGNKVLLLINNVLKKWGDTYETILEVDKNTVSSMLYNTISYTLNIPVFEKGIAKNTFNNFKCCMIKDMGYVSEDFSCDMIISDFPIINYSNRTGKLIANYEFYECGILKYKIIGTISGVISDTYKKENSRKSKGSSKKGAKRK